MFKHIVLILAILGMCEVGWSKGRSSGFKSRPSARRTVTTPKRSAPPSRSVKPVNKQTQSRNKAKENGTLFKTRAQAEKSFVSKNKEKYKSTYSKEPASRPAHIPQTYSQGGSTYNISYNSSMGGYGYMGPSGSWMMYDAMTDAIMLNALMSSNHYHYGAAPVATTHYSVSWASIFTGIIITIIIVLAVATYLHGDGF